ncbi:MAG: PHB depolymerase family esterase [Stellaceae bacterium]
MSSGRPGAATAILQRSLGIALPETAAERTSEALQSKWRDWLGAATPLSRAGPRPPVPEPQEEGLTGQFLNRTYSNVAGTRRYRLYVPNGFDGEPAPLLVMLHGCKQSPEDFAAGTRMNAQAEKSTWLMAYPEQPVSANGSRCWNWFRPEDQRHGEGEPSIVAGITRQIMHDFAIDPARVYVAGLSAGGAAAAVMGSVYPDLYAAVGIHSGLARGAARDVQSAFTAMRNGAQAAPPDGSSIMPTIVFHGDRDRTVNPQNVALILAQAAAGIELEKLTAQGQVPNGHAYTRTQHVDHAGSIVLESWIVHGQAHAWSGGSREGSYTDPRGPDATAEMFRFFRNHSRAGLK